MPRSAGNPAIPEAAAAPSRRWSLADGHPRLVRLAVIAPAAGTCLASAAAVADNFYLHGGIGLDRPGEMVFTDTDCSSTVPAALRLQRIANIGDPACPVRRSRVRREERMVPLPRVRRQLRGRRLQG